MDRNLITCLILFFTSTLGLTQNEGNNLYPVPGDTLDVIKTQIRSVPGENLYGSNNVWNYLFLDAPYVEELLFLKPQSGSAFSYFPEADVMSLGSNGEEIYYKTNNGNVIEVGKFGPNEWLLGDKYLIDYLTSPVVKKKGQKLNYRFNDYSSFYVDMSITKVNDMGIEINMPLSSNTIRFQFEIDKNVTFDAEGDLLLPFGNYKVLKSTEEVTIETKLMVPSEMGWRELSENYYVLNNPKIEIGKVYRNNYRFWNDSFKLPLLSIVQTGAGAFDVIYLNEDKKSKLPIMNNKVKDVMAFPNPTFGDITFQLVNHPAGPYTLRIYDLVNKPKFSQVFHVRANGKINANLGFLREGTYLYSIIDDFGKKITTKRVVILRP